MCSKLSTSVGTLYKLKSFLPEEIIENLYYSLVHPHIIYNIESWFGASQIMIKKSEFYKENHQEQFLIFNLLTIRNPFSKKNNLILELDDLYKFSLSFSMFNYINNSINHKDIISSCISFNSTHHECQTRMRSNLSVIHFNRINNWNNLPTKLKNITSSANFRIKLKNHFCSQY